MSDEQDREREGDWTWLLWMGIVIWIVVKMAWSKIGG
jgi:predicted nucleic acid-binding Zn ribbon protein